MYHLSFTNKGTLRTRMIIPTETHQQLDSGIIKSCYWQLFIIPLSLIYFICLFGTYRPRSTYLPFSILYMTMDKPIG